MGEGQPPPKSEFVPRIGTFLILMGIFSLIFFITSDLAQKPDFDWLIVGLLLLSIGLYLRSRAAPLPAAGRFGMIRKLREDAKKRREKARKK